GGSAGGEVELQLDAVAGGQQALFDLFQLLTMLLAHFQMDGAHAERRQQQEFVRAHGRTLLLNVRDMGTQQRSRLLEKRLLPARGVEGIVRDGESQNRDCVIVVHALAMTLPVPVAGLAPDVFARCSRACKRATTAPCFSSISMTCSCRVSFSSLMCSRAAVNS